MKCNFILQLLFLALKQIIQCNSKNVPTIEDIKSYKYGSDPFTLAIIGDSGTTKEAKKVMELSSFDALLHLGDFDYNCLPDKYFIEVLNQQRSYQFMGVAGNHDAIPQCNKDIAQKFLNNIYYHMVSDKNNKTTCEFSASKYMWSCVYKNMRIIGLTPGVSGADSRKEQLSFLKTHLRDAKEDWKICSWHFYDKYYHTGKYQQYGNIVSGDRDGDESFYDYCKDHGAIIFSAHDHVYARTKVMLKFTKPVIDKFDENADGTVVQIRNGATFNILSGTGGYEVYVEQGEQKNYNHWRKKYAKGDNNENAKRFGGLFCNFNVDGNNRKAYCQFLRINSSEKVFDSFYIYRNDDPGSVTYKNIDENFEYEKLKAYKIENNIQDEPIIEKDETNKKDDPHSVKENND
ncbi:Metallo-dependent phosphatase, partial [Piromyces finnis]